MTSGRQWRFVAIAAVLAAALLLGYSHLTARARRAAAVAPAAAVPPTQLGMNLGNPTFWSSEWTFADLVQSTAMLVFMTPKGEWQPFKNQVPLDATGHPVGVPAGTKLNIMIQQGSPRLPVGVYDCTISKGWSIRAFGDWKMTGSGQRFRMTVTQPVSRNGIVLLLTATADKASLTDLSCKPPGVTSTFNPAFLADTKPFGVIRYMDWMRTNGAPSRTWATRATPGFFSQTGPEGAAIEHMIALANEAGSDPWITLPLDADPSYYREMARYVRDHLDPKRRVYVELSNETWNTAFLQAKQTSARGAELYPNASPSEQNDFYYADRVRDAMQVWSDIFKGQERRLVRVLASQQVNPRRAEQRLSHKDTWRFVDALATAAYFGTNGADVQAAPGAARVDAIFVRGPALVEATIAQSRANKAIAQARGLRYIAYEGGPDFSSFRPDLRADTLAVLRDPRMHDLYLLFLRRWKAEIGDTLVLYNSVSTPGPGGWFGHREYTGQPLGEAPKARALAEFAGE